MNPLRLAVRFPTAKAPSDLSKATDVFHRFIQRGKVEGLLIDVADYRHVPDGPGMVLIGHDIDHALTDGALTSIRKRQKADAATQLRDLLRMALGTIDAIEADQDLDATFDRSSFTVTVFDRSLGSRDEVAAALLAAVQPVVAALFGDDAAVTAVLDVDPRSAPQVEVAASADAAATVLDKLGGSRAPGQSPWDIEVEELKRLLDAEAEIVLLDVREESEYEKVNLGGKLIPLAELEDRMGELDKDARVVIHCRAGRRGGIAVQQLREAGFTDAWNVNGALVAWADRIDPTTLRY